MADELKLLIIDDDAVDRMTITRSLRKSGMQVHIDMAETGTDGLGKLQQESYDCLFIDFRLPDIDGLQLLQQIRSAGIFTPVLLVTSHGDERLAAQAIRLGASDYIPKTLLNSESLTLSIRTAIRLHQAEQQKLAVEQDLIHAQKQLDLIVSSSPIMLWGIDKSGIFTFSKGKGLDLIGLSGSQLTGKSIFEVYAAFPEILANVKRALKGETIIQVMQLGSFYFNSHYLPNQDEHGQIVGVSGVSFDITDRINSEKELEKAKNLAEESVRIKEQFLANMSHEIRTPMNGIIGLSNVLQKTPLSPDQRKYLNAIRTSADNLLVIINDILDFSKIQAGKVTFEETTFNLPEVIRHIMAVLEVRAHERFNSLHYTIDNNVPEHVTGDPVRLSQILNNLIGNAIKFTEHGSVCLTISCMKQTDDETLLQFSVSDTGIGIPEDKLETIFESFTQASNDTTRKYGGTGLGLTISRRFVELQGGKIEVKSRYGKGSLFSFTIPFRLCEKNDTSHPDEEGNAEKAPCAEELGKLNVLLAEDNEINQLLVSQLMSDWNFNLDVVENGKQALEKLSEKDYDLVLMDMQMPVMTGYEAIEQIRQSDSTLQTMPVIALTAHATSGEVEKCLAAGANAYVSKPFDPDELLLKIAELLHARLTAKPVTEESWQADLESLNRHREDEFMLELLQLFVRQTPKVLWEIQQASKAGDWKNLLHFANELKTDLQILGIFEPARLLSRIEQLAETRRHTLDLERKVEKLVHVSTHIINHLNKTLPNSGQKEPLSG